MYTKAIAGAARRRTQRVIGVCLTLMALVSGCAGGPGVGWSDAALAGNPNAMWEEGQKSAEAGEALVSKGEKRLAEGRKQVREGEAMISDGNQRVLQARQDYQAAADATGGVTAPKEVEAEAKRLKTIGSRWEKAIGSVRSGNKLVDKGNKNIQKGQSEIREGRKLLESGSDLMRNSQRRRLGQKKLPARSSD